MGPWTAPNEAIYGVNIIFSQETEGSRVDGKGKIALLSKDSREALREVFAHLP